MPVQPGVQGQAVPAEAVSQIHSPSVRKLAGTTASWADDGRPLSGIRSRMVSTIGQPARPGHDRRQNYYGTAYSSATSIHAYSPPLSAMTYYTATDFGLIARETVAIDGPEGGRGHGGAALG